MLILHEQPFANPTNYSKFITLMNDGTKQSQSSTTESIPVDRLIKWQHDFLKHYANMGKSDNSLKCYRLDFHCFNDFMAGNTGDLSAPLKDFNNAVVDFFRTYLENRYSNINSIRRKLQTLRLFFDFLVQAQLYPSNPIKKIASAPKSLLPPRPNTFPQVLKLALELQSQTQEAQTQEDGHTSPVELDEIISLRNLMIFHFIYHGCLTVSQLCKIQVDDIFIDSPHGQNHLRIMIRPEKRDPYSITLPIFIQKWLHSYLKKLSLYQKSHGLNFQDFLFNANAHRILRGGLSARGIEEIFSRWSKAMDFNITPKSLRQSGIINLMNQKIPFSRISEKLGVAPSYDFSAYVEYYRNHDHCQHYSDVCIH